MFFNPKLKQTKVWQVELNRLNDRGKKDTHACASTTKKVLKDKRKKKKKKQEHFHKHSMNIFTVRDL